MNQQEKLRTLLTAATIVAASAPEKLKAHQVECHVPSQGIEMLRASLDEIGADWRKVRREMRKSK